MPPSRPQYTADIGNRGFFDLNDNFLFDYVYDPTRSTGFGGPAPSVSRPILGFNRPGVGTFTTSTTTTTTTRRPWTPAPSVPKVDPQPAVAPLRPNDVSEVKRPAATTEAPSIFHSSDYDFDLDDAIVVNRFGKIATFNGVI